MLQLQILKYSCLRSLIQEPKWLNGVGQAYGASRESAKACTGGNSSAEPLPVEILFSRIAGQPGKGSKRSAPCQLEKRCQVHPNRSRVRRA